MLWILEGMPKNCALVTKSSNTQKMRTARKVYGINYIIGCKWQLKNTNTNIQTKPYRNLVAVPFPELMTSESERERPGRNSCLDMPNVVTDSFPIMSRTVNHGH